MRVDKIPFNSTICRTCSNRKTRYLVAMPRRVGMYSFKTSQMSLAGLLGARVEGGLVRGGRGGGVADPWPVGRQHCMALMQSYYVFALMTFFNVDYFLYSLFRYWNAVWSVQLCWFEIEYKSYYRLFNISERNTYLPTKIIVFAFISEYISKVRYNFLSISICF